MKKRPQQCQRQVKSNTNIKSFINNLKENDLHFEDNQITQCVFLGVLRLKPVPSVFSSNTVPCLVVENKSKKPKNNNNTKEVNKNVSRKKDINKVISGRIGKKNTDIIRASVKKEPLKKGAIKLKLNMNKKDTTSKDSLESVRILPESLTKITSESVLTNRTITLNPITNVPTFNPVQNLFAKLKQQLDVSLNRPSCSSEVNKQTLFSDKSRTDIQLSSKKQKKGINKTKISSVGTFSDNSSHPNNSIYSKLTEDVFLINEDSTNEDCEVLLNTGPMPNFVLDTSKTDNDVILITDDNSDISSASKDLIVVDDVKCVRSSPRLNRNEQRSSPQKITATPETIINLDDGESNDKEKVAPKTKVEKPKKRRTLMPSAIPSIFFNTPRLLRSELGQKKGSFSEPKNVAKNSTTKIQKPENKLEKLPAKQRKESKLKNSTENIIYEVVKSTENIRLFADVVTNSQDDVVLVERSPPKVEPLILKLKKSTEKTADQNAIEDIRNKEKSQKMYTKNVTRNLFFPRLLRSDINQPKDSKQESTKKSTKTIEIGSQKTSQAKNEKYVPSASIGRISVKPVEQLIEKSPKQDEHRKNTTQKVTEKNIAVRDTVKKNEKSLPTSSKILGSQVQNASNIITIEDSDSTNLIDIFSQNNGKNKNIDNTSCELQNQSQLRSDDSQNKSNESVIEKIRKNVPKTSTIADNIEVIGNTSCELQNQRQLRSDDTQNKGNESIIEKIRKNVPKTSTIADNIEVIDVEFQSSTKTTPTKKQELKNASQEQSHVRQLRSDSPHKKANNAKPVAIDELNKTNGKSKTHSPKTGNDTVEDTVASSLKSKNKEDNVESISVDILSKVQGTPTVTKTGNTSTGTKTKNIAVVQPMSRQPTVELSQKKIAEKETINHIQNQNITSLEEITKGPTKHIVTDMSIHTEPESQPTHENTTALTTVAVGRFYSSDVTPQTVVSLQERRQLRSDDTVDKNTKPANLELNISRTDIDKLKTIEKATRKDSKTKTTSTKDKTKDTELEGGSVQQKTEAQKQISENSPTSKSTEQSDQKILRSSTVPIESKNASNQVEDSKVKAVGAQENLTNNKSIASDRNIKQDPNTNIKSKILESEDTSTNSKKTIKKYGRNILKCKTNSPTKQKKVITKKSIKKPSKSITFKTITKEVTDSDVSINKEISKSDSTSTSKRPLVKKIVHKFKKLASKKQLLKSTNLSTKKQSPKLKKKQTADSQITSQASLIVYSVRTPPKTASSASDSSQTITKKLKTPQKDTNNKILSDPQSNTILDTSDNVKSKDCSSGVKIQKTNVPKSNPSKSEKKTETTVSLRNIPNTSTSNVSQEQSENLDQTKAHSAISSSKNDSTIQTKTKSSLVPLQKKDKMKQKINFKLYKKKLTRNLLRPIKKSAKVAPTADLKIISESNVILNSRRSISKLKAPEEAFKINQKEFNDSEVIKPTGPSESKVSTNESGDSPVHENGNTGNDIKNKLIKKQKALSIKKTIGSKIAANIKKTSIKLQNKKHNIEIKKRRGRPRRNPLEIKLDKTPTLGMNFEVSTQEVTLDKADNAVSETTGEVKRKAGRPKKQQGEAVLDKEQLNAATGEKGPNDTMHCHIPEPTESKKQKIATKQIKEEIIKDINEKSQLNEDYLNKTRSRSKKLLLDLTLDETQVTVVEIEEEKDDHETKSQQTNKTDSIKRKRGRQKKISLDNTSTKTLDTEMLLKQEIIDDENREELDKTYNSTNEPIEITVFDNSQVTEFGDENKIVNSSEIDIVKKKRGRPKRQTEITLDDIQVESTNVQKIVNKKPTRSSILAKTQDQAEDILSETENSNIQIQTLEISNVKNTKHAIAENIIVESNENEKIKRRSGRPKKVMVEGSKDETTVLEVQSCQGITDDKNDMSQSMESVDIKKNKRDSLKTNTNKSNRDQTAVILDDKLVCDNRVVTRQEQNIEQPKKKIGQVRKQIVTPLLVEDIVIKSDEKEENNLVQSGKSAEVKKKRGRPFKVSSELKLEEMRRKQIETPLLDEVIIIKSDEKEENKMGKSGKGAEVKKKRGRPFKVPTELKLEEMGRRQIETPVLDEVIVIKSDEQEENKLAQPDKNVEVKKKRGRSFKVPNELELDLTEAGQEQKTKKPKMTGREIKNLQMDLKLSEKTSDKNTANKKKPLQKTQEDLDVIMIVPEKRNKKQINTPLKTLRSSLNQVEKKRAVNIAQPTVEKVVALIHSEPRPKQQQDASEITLNHIEGTKESKTRVLRSQNVNEIDSTHVVKEDTKKSRLTKGHKIATKKGVSEKSINIIKSKTKLSKAFTGNKGATKKKNLKTDVMDKSKLKKMSNKSKQTVLKQIKTKLQNSKNKNVLKRSSRTKKSPSFNKKRSVDWDNNDIIERIIQEIRNTLFKEESNIIRKKIKQKKITLKTQKKKITKPVRIKREAFLAAKKKMMQTKEALKQKLRNAKNEVNTSGESESKENNPPKTEMEQLEDSKNECKTEEVLVESTQEDDVMITGETSFQSDVTNQTKKTDKHKKPELVNRTRRSYRSTLVSRHMASIVIGDDKEGENIDSKKNDITVFDFDESEPEVTPLRHKSVPKLNDFETPLFECRDKKTSNIELISSTPINSSATSNSQKSSILRSGRNPVPLTSVTENEIIEIPENVKQKTSKIELISSTLINSSATSNSQKSSILRSGRNPVPLTSVTENEIIEIPENVKQKTSKIELISSTLINSSATSNSQKSSILRSGRNPVPLTSVTENEVIGIPENVKQKTSNIELISSTPINSSATSNSQKSSILRSGRNPVPVTSVTENEIIEIPESSVSAVEQKPTLLEGDSSYSQEQLSKIKILKQDRLFSEILVYPDGEEEIVKDKPVSIEKENPVTDVKEHSSPEGGEMPCQELSSKRRKLLVPYIDDHGKPKKLWSVIETPRVPDTPPRPITPRQALSSPRRVRRSNSLDMVKPSTSAVKPAESDSPEEKKSPWKQPTIIEMFSKVWMKKEIPAKNLSEENNCKTEESIFQRPSTPDLNVTAPSPRRDRVDDEDSDTESRAEWIPEEYAEYKFKYSNSKLMQYKPIFKCKICLVVVPSYYKLLKHRKEHDVDKPYKCPQCSHNFSNVDDFSAHLRLHKGKHPYMCPKCDLGFWTKSAYEAHQPVHILKKAKQPVKKFRCDVCAKEFSKLCDVERHTRVHTGEKPCICNICNKRFQQAHNLSKHLLTHLHIKPFYCEICNKQFGRNDVLRRHLLTHSVDKPVKCSVCHRGFIRHSQLLQHMRRKHKRRPVEDVGESNADPNESESSETKDDGFDNQPSTSKSENESHDK
uniref:Titin-like n=1 Tax=Diabrotica virgifera virgifera TaxID=50390 RepID=A0A6P7FJ95_DIAVI